MSDDTQEEILCEKTINFKSALNTIVEECLNSVSEQTFISLYKSLFSEFEKKDNITKSSLGGSSKEAKKFRDLFNDVVQNTVSSEIDDMLKEFNINEKMKLMEAIIAKSKDDETTKAWRPPGNANKHVDAFDYDVKMFEKKQLEDMLVEDYKEVKALEMELEEKRIKIQELYKDIQDTNHKLENLFCVSINNDTSELY